MSHLWVLFYLELLPEQYIKDCWVMRVHYNNHVPSIPLANLALNTGSIKSDFFVIGIGEFLRIHPPKESNMIFHHLARARIKGMTEIDSYI